MKVLSLSVCSVIFSLASTMGLASMPNPVVNPSSAFVGEFCKTIESYQPGSAHYFFCLETGETLVQEGATGQQLIEGVCDALIDLFYDPSSAQRCRADGNALLESF